jgi:mono/diheme cytochrome c family protein
MAKEASSMRAGFRAAVILALVFAVSGLAAAALHAQAGNAAEAAKLKNPVRADASSIAAGKKLYDAQCAACHGSAGRGDGKGGMALNPKPSDLTDAEWKHGSTDGALFVAVRDGVEKTGMRGYASRMTPNDIWHVVNYVRTLSKLASSH